MKKIIILLLLITNFTFSQEIIYHSPFEDLKNGEYYYLFGDNVAFRAEPNLNSIAIKILEIGTKLQIIEKTDETINYYGTISNYYKVKIENEIGYILGSLISLGKKRNGKLEILLYVCKRKG